MNQIAQLPNDPDPEFLKKILEDQRVMIELTKQSLFYFFNIYFQIPDRHPSAPFHQKMFDFAQDDSTKRVCVVAFRNSAKSIILDTAYALWSVMGIQEKKFVIIASQTQERAYGHLKNIRKEIEENKLLRQHLGPFEEKTDQWNTSTLIIPKYKARISAISVEEGIRGVREGSYRPELIIADDIESLSSTKTLEARDKTYNWLTGELLPIGNKNTKLVMLGNFLHTDAAIVRFQNLIKKGAVNGKSLTVPIVDGNNNITWPGMFPTMEELEKYKASFGSEIAWQREFMLNPIDSEYQIVKKDWLQYYSKMPELKGDDYRGTFIAIDPASAQSEIANYTAMVIVSVFGDGDDAQIFVHPNPINKRMTVMELEQKAFFLARSFPNCSPTIVVEGGGTQKAISQFLMGKGFRVEEYKIGGVGKEERLTVAASSVQAGKVFFQNNENASKNDKELINQILKFGIERHDDLADAFSMAICKATEQRKSIPEVFTVGGDDDDD